MSIQSPLNYTGGKFKLLPQITPLLPDDVEVFVDLFGGGFNVGINIDTDIIIYNEYSKNVHNLVKGICCGEITEDKIDKIIKEYNLNKENKEGYLRLREKWNSDIEKDNSELYTLICYAFNNQIRFNSKGEFNIPFGRDRGFNSVLRNKFNTFQEKAKKKNIFFYNESFEKITDFEGIGDSYFFYCDPPYLLTTATYNEKNGWNNEMEIRLYNELDKLNRKGAKFALSNVLEHKGKVNKILMNWMSKYNVYHLEHSYANCSYHGKKHRQVNRRDSSNKLLTVIYSTM